MGVWRRRKRDIDLGGGHWLRYWSNNTTSKAGAFVVHPKGPKPTPWDVSALVGRTRCVGSVTFNVPGNEKLTAARWTVESREPLTLSPSLLCDCGDHGFIRSGQWVGA